MTAALTVSDNHLFRTLASLKNKAKTFIHCITECMCLLYFPSCLKDLTTIQQPFERFHTLAACPLTLLTTFIYMHDYAFTATEARSRLVCLR